MTEIMKDLRLEEAKGCATLADDRIGNGLSDNDVEMSAEEAKQYRSMVARANYLGLDRPDIQFRSRASCKRVPKPMKGDFEHSKRLGRKIRSHPRAILSFQWQHDVPELIVRADSDWTRDKRNRASVSGGMLMIGSHLIKSCRRTRIERGREAGARLSCMLQTRECYKALDLCRWQTNGSVQMGPSLQFGRKRDEGHPEALGKERHVEVAALWAQSVFRSGRTKRRGTGGLSNTADLGTKPLP